MIVYHGSIEEINKPNVDHSKEYLDFVYKQNLEISIIEQLAKTKNITSRQAMDIYYKSRLSEQIQSGQYGIENLDYKYLAEDLIENESELFAGVK